MRKYALMAACLALATGNFACGPKEEASVATNTPPAVPPPSGGTTTSTTPPANTPPATTTTPPAGTPPVGTPSDAPSTASQPPAPAKVGQTVKMADGLEYTDKVIGTGASPVAGQKVLVHYVGTLKDGTEFDSSVRRGQPFDFVIGVGQVIKGWDEGVLTMKVGGTRKLVIPPSLGYGAVDKGKIPPNSTLLFDVVLLDVK